MFNDEDLKFIENLEQLGSMTQQLDAEDGTTAEPPAPTEPLPFFLDPELQGLSPTPAPVEEPAIPAPPISEAEHGAEFRADEPTKKGLGDHFTEAYGSPEGRQRFMPFFHSAGEAIELVDVLAAIRRQKKGGYKDTFSGHDAKNRDERILADYEQKIHQEAEQQKANGAEADTWGEAWSHLGYKVGETASNMPAFVMEFLATAGMFQSVRVIGRKAARKGLKGIVKNKAARIGAARLAGAAAGTAARTSMFAVQITARTAKEMIPDYDFSENEAGDLALLVNEDSGKNIAHALSIAYVDQFIENLSEVSGPATARAFKKLPGARKVAAVKLALAKRYLSGTKSATLAKMRKRLAKGGWNGMFEEWGEERVGDALRTPVGLQTVEGLVKGWTDPEQIATELGAFALPGAGQMALAQAQGVVNAPKRKRAEKAYKGAFWGSVNSQKGAPDADGAFLDSLEQQFGPKSSLEIDNEATQKKKDRERDQNVLDPPSNDDSDDSDGGAAVKLPTPKPLPPADRTTKSDEKSERGPSTPSIDKESDVKPGATPSARPETDQNADGVGDKAKPAPKKSVVAGQPVAANPSEGQKEAGNYPMGHAKVDGLDISIENPVGSERSGTDKNGKEWKQKLHSDYGYFRGSVGYDKDHVDVFIKPGYKGGGGPVFVVDQVDPKTRKFDEAKAMLGYGSAAEAIEAYNKNYEPGWRGLGNLTEMNPETFKSWVFSKDDGPAQGHISAARLLRHDVTVGAKPETPSPKADEAKAASKRPTSINGHGRRFHGVVPGDVMSGSGQHGVTFVRRSGDKVYWKNDGGGTGWMWARNIDTVFSHNKKINRAEGAENETPAPAEPKAESTPAPKHDLKAELIAMSDDDFDALFDEAAEEVRQAKANIVEKGEVSDDNDELQPGDGQASRKDGPRDAAVPPKKKPATPAQEKARAAFVRRRQVADQDKALAAFRERHKHIRRPPKNDPLYEELASKEHGAIPYSRFLNDPRWSFPEAVFDAAVEANLATSDEDMCEALRRIFRTRLKTVGEVENAESAHWDNAQEAAEDEPRTAIAREFASSIEEDIRPPEARIERYREEFDKALADAGVNDADLHPDSWEPPSDEEIEFIDNAESGEKSVAEWEAEHGIEKPPEQDEMFGKGAVGDQFALTEEQDNGDARKYDEQQKAQAAAEKAERDQGTMDLDSGLSASDIIKDAAKLGVTGIDEAMKGLHELFGGGTHMGMGVTFDEETYAAAKPHFEAAFNKFRAAGKNAKEYFSFLIEKFGDSIKPYLKRFKEELSGKVVSPEAAPAPAASGSPSLKAAQEIAESLKENVAITKPFLQKVMDRQYGGTMAEGKYTVKDLYDAMELGINLHINSEEFLPSSEIAGAYMAQGDPGSAAEMASHYAAILDMLPTQTNRTDEQVKLQQFSTPPDYAYAVNWVANIQLNDVYLEPSAGLGGLAVFARGYGRDITIIANELSDRRADLLKASGIADRVSTHNAEHLNAFLDPSIQSGKMERPSVVVMNPPFSNAANTDKKSMTVGTKHVDEALAVLKPGGRLVAIIGGKGRYDDSKAVKAWLTGLQHTTNLRAIVDVDGSVYGKYGTTYGTRVLVIDKPGPTDVFGLKQPKTGTVQTVTELIDFLSEVRDERSIDTSTDSDSGAEPVGGGGGQAGNQPGPRDSGSGYAGDRPGGHEQDTGPVGDAAPGDSDAERPGDSGDSQSSPERSPDGGSEDRTPDERSDDARSGNRSDTRIASEVTLEEAEPLKADESTLDDNRIYDDYVPAYFRMTGAQPHPTAVVESSSMAAVKPPAINYVPNLPQSVVINGVLSLIQLEAIAYTGQSHSIINPDGTRRGFIIGDGTGVGKGREIAGIILDNWRQGRKKAIWISEKAELVKDARRDIGAVAGDKMVNDTFDMTKVKAKTGKIKNHKGILFTTYKTLAKLNRGFDQNGDRIPPPPENKSRMDQIIDWVGVDYDGVIAFDEAHNAANNVATQGSRGMKPPSQQALAVVDLQKALPKARIVYVTATAATEVSNLGYLERIGMWGHGTAFSSKSEFIANVSQGGVSTMEVVARDLKALGLMCARTLSFEGVTFTPPEETIHNLTPDQRVLYNNLASAWQLVMQNMDAAMDHSGQAQSGRAYGAARSAFFGAELRFYEQLLASLQMPSVIASMKEDLAVGNSIVVQLIKTNEAPLERELERLAGEESVEYDDLDLTTRNILLHYLDSSFPTGLYEERQNPDGSISVVAVMGDDGLQLEDPEAVRRKHELMDHVAGLAFPDNPIEMILNEFGTDEVAEITGRKQRIVMKENDEGQIVRTLQKRRTDKVREAEANDFDDGKRRILIFSDKGGTGRSYHASKDIANQQRRCHHVIQAGWRADKCIQGFGRTHRSNQALAPIYKMWSTDINGHKRFIATIARRLQQLGALSAGERKTAGKGMFSEKDNVESSYGASAVRRLFRDWFAEPDGVGGLTFIEMNDKLGYKNMIDADTGTLNEDKIPPVSTFLNRILALEVDEQNRVFDAFMSRMSNMIDNAIERGNYDPGLQTYRADSIETLKDDVVYTHQESQATTRLVEVEAKIKINFTAFDDIGSLGTTPVLGYARNLRSGKLVAIKDGPDQTNTATGRVTKGKRLVSPQSIETDSELNVTVASEQESTPPAPVTFSSWEHDEEDQEITAKIAGGEIDSVGRDALKSLLRKEGFEGSNAIVLADGLALALSEGQEVDEAHILAMVNDVIGKRFDIELKKKYHYAAMSEANAKQAWGAYIETADPFHRRTETFVVGTMLPIWDRLRIDPRVFRFKPTDGEKILGVHVPPGKLDALRNRLGAGVGSEITASGAFRLVMDEGLTLSLANGWRLSRRKVSSEWRIELMGVTATAYFKEFEDYVGGFVERINYKPRLFVPVDREEGEAALEKIIAKSPIAEVISSGGSKLTSLDDIRADVGRGIDDFIGGGDSMQAGLPLPIDSPKKTKAKGIKLPGDTRLQSTDPEVERRFRAAKLQRPGMMAKAAAAAKAIYRSFTRSFRHLEKQDGATKDVLRQFHEVPSYSRAMAIDVLRGLLAELSPQQYDVFSRMVILPDLLKDIDGELYSEGAALPFGYADRDALIADLEKFQMIADMNPEIGKALEQREKFMTALREDLVRADLLSETVLEDPAYFHHQVLQYMNGEDFMGTGTASKDVRMHRKGWQRARKGSELDYNTQYVESEFEVIAQGLAQLATKETLERLDSMLNIESTLKAEAKHHNLVAAHGGQEKYDRVQELRQMLRETNDRKEKAMIHEELNDIDVLAPFRMRITRSKAVIAKLIKNGAIVVPSRFRQTADDILSTFARDEEGDNGALIDEHGDQGNFMEFMAWIADLPGTEKRPALGIFKAIADREAYIKSAAGEEFKTISDLIPEGYTKWQPEKGNRFFWALTTTEKIIEKAMEQDHVLTPDEYSRMMVVGGRKKEWIIPERIAKTLDNIQGNTDHGVLDTLAQSGIRGWKVWTLLNPFRVVKYNVNNMSGDLDIVLAYNPAILKYGLQAAKDLTNYHLKKKSATKEIAEAIRLGVIGSGWSVQELPDVSTEDFFATLTGKKRNPAKWWWDKTKSVTQWREDILRLAAFRHFKAQLAKGKVVYAASRKNEIDAINSNVEKAAKLSRELVGDYGALSESGMWIRKRLIPFYSWMEINLPRYVRLMKNTRHEGGTAGKSVRGVATVAWRTGVFAFKANIMFLAIALYNRLAWPDEDEELRRERRKGHHLILGRDSDGDIRTIRFEGALSDALAWFDLQDYPKDIADVLSGKATVMDKVKDAGWAVAERFVIGARPIERSLLEAYAFKKQLWPDMRHPRPVRDPQEHMARTFSLGMIYKIAAGKPSKGTAHNIQSLAVYKVNPGEAAYYTIRGLAGDYLERKDYDRPSVTPSRRQNHLYYYKTALRYGDKRAADKYLALYKSMGGTDRGKKASITSAQPLGFMPIRERSKFTATLNRDERKILNRAQAWYKATYKPNAGSSW